MPTPRRDVKPFQLASGARTCHAAGFSGIQQNITAARPGGLLWAPGAPLGGVIGDAVKWPSRKLVTAAAMVVPWMHARGGGRFMEDEDNRGSGRPLYGALSAIVNHALRVTGGVDQGIEAALLEISHGSDSYVYPTPLQGQNAGLVRGWTILRRRGKGTHIGKVVLAGLCVEVYDGMEDAVRSFILAPTPCHIAWNHGRNRYQEKLEKAISDVRVKKEEYRA